LIQDERITIVVTSISKPNRALLSLSQGCIKYGYQFIVIGDVASPADFNIQGCDYYDIDRQIRTGLKFAKLCPQRHYARKNIGYLLAIQEGTHIIIDTDDDNIPYPSFWDPRKPIHNVPVVGKKGWLNIYSYFSDANIWPRGFPLNKIHSTPPSFDSCLFKLSIVQFNKDFPTKILMLMRFIVWFYRFPRISETIGKLLWAVKPGAHLTVKTQHGGKQLFHYFTSLLTVHLE